jgi:glycosyltransferase involved in cell wall biosynthesis
MAKDKLSIAFVYPFSWGNNGNFQAIAYSLLKKYNVYLILPRRNEPHNFEYWDSVKIVYVNPDLFMYEDLRYKNDEIKSIKLSLIFGMDIGIFFANKISKQQNIPLAYISYEILFSNECDALFKDMEIAACKDIKFALCQDSMRSHLLSIENKIPIGKIFNIPVCNLHKHNNEKSDYLREKFNISKDKKIVLYVGGIATLMDADLLFKAVKKWNENWVLVIHCHSDYIWNCEQVFDKNGIQRIFFDKEYIADFRDMGRLVKSADVGICSYSFYKTESSNFFVYIGKNCLFMGLASGKVNTYLEYGKPVIINNVTNLANIVCEYNLGEVVNSFDEIDFNSLQKKIPKLIKNCEKFYKRYLDFPIYKNNLLQLVDNVIQKKSVEQIIAKNNKLSINTKTLNSMQLKNIYDLTYNNKNSIALDNFYNFANRAKNLYIYGAGNYGRRLAYALYVHKIDFSGFLISNSQIKDTSLNREVFLLKELKSEPKHTRIIIGIVDNKIKKAVLKDLHRKGFKDIFSDDVYGFVENLFFD